MNSLDLVSEGAKAALSLMRRKFSGLPLVLWFSKLNFKFSGW